MKVRTLIHTSIASLALGIFLSPLVWAHRDPVSLYSVHYRNTTGGAEFAVWEVPQQGNAVEVVNAFMPGHAMLSRCGFGVMTQGMDRAGVRLLIYDIPTQNFHLFGNNRLIKSWPASMISSLERSADGRGLLYVGTLRSREIHEVSPDGTDRLLLDHRWLEASAARDSAQYGRIDFAQRQGDTIVALTQTHILHFRMPNGNGVPVELEWVHPPTPLSAGPLVSTPSSNSVFFRLDGGLLWLASRGSSSGPYDVYAYDLARQRELRRFRGVDLQSMVDIEPSTGNLRIVTSAGTFATLVPKLNQVREFALLSGSAGIVSDGTLARRGVTALTSWRFMDAVAPNWSAANPATGWQFVDFERSRPSQAETAFPFSIVPMTDLSRTSAAQAERPWPTREDLERELYWYLETYRDWITGARVDPNGEMIIDHLMLVLNALPEIREWVDGTIVIHTGRMNDRLALTRYQRLVNLLYRAMRNDPHTFAARLAWTLAIREHGVMAGGNRVIDIRGQLPSSGQIGVRELAGMVYEAAVCRDAFKR